VHNRQRGRRSILKDRSVPFYPDLPADVGGHTNQRGFLCVPRIKTVRDGVAALGKGERIMLEQSNPYLLREITVYQEMVDVFRSTTTE